MRDIKYKAYEMAGYLKPNEYFVSVRERQFLFQCRVNDIDIRANRSWKYKETHCLACKDENTEETGRHILESKVSCSEKDEISYIPSYADLFSSNVQEQVYTCQIMSKNMQIRKKYLPLP